MCTGCLRNLCRYNCYVLVFCELGLQVAFLFHKWAMRLSKELHCVYIKNDGAFITKV